MWCYIHRSAHEGKQAKTYIRKVEANGIDWEREKSALNDHTPIEIRAEIDRAITMKSFW